MENKEESVSTPHVSKNQDSVGIAYGPTTDSKEAEEDVKIFSVKLAPFPNNELSFYTEDGIHLCSKTVSAEQHKKLGYKVDIEFIDNCIQSPPTDQTN